MEFAFTEEQEELREMVKEFVEKEITPFAEEMDRNNAATPDLFKKAADMGLLNVKNMAGQDLIALLLP